MSDPSATTARHVSPWSGEPGTVGTVAVVGMGYVGLPLAVALAESGARVVGIEVSAERAAGIAAGRSHVGDVPSEVLPGLLASRDGEPPRLSTTTRFDTAVRAQSIRGRMAPHGLIVPTQAHWYPAFRAELLSFPAGKHDDQVDAMGLIGQLLDRMGPGRELPPPKKEEPTRSGPPR